jgi:T3SS negative regulator,GrlR
MENGIYQIRLCSGHDEENGVVVITDGAVNGGSGTYLYQGRLSVERSALSGSFKIRKWNREAPATLGAFKEISLAVEGQVALEERSFSFIGRFAGHHVVRIEATGFYLAPLAEP